MAKLGGTKFTWVINKFSSLKSQTLHSAPYGIGTTGYACYLVAVRGADEPEDLSVFIHYSTSLPTEPKIYLKYRLAIVNQVSEELFIFKEGMQRLYPTDLLNKSVVLLPKVFDKDSGFLVNDQVKIVVEVDIFQDIPVETEKTEENDGVLLKEGSSIMESINVHGFHVFPSQVGCVRRLFEKHPDIGMELVSRLLKRHPEIASDFSTKNSNLRTGYMSLLV